MTGVRQPSCAHLTGTKRPRQISKGGNSWEWTGIGNPHPRAVAFFSALARS